MGMLNIEMYGSFEKGSFSTCAEEGGHVAALKRGIQYLAQQLGPAVILDAELTKDGESPPQSPLGCDKPLL